MKRKGGKLKNLRTKHEHEHENISNIQSILFIFVDIVTFQNVFGVVSVSDN